ncbi:hypothetical protein [Ciceribacter thiooxidans]|uniref:Regulator of nucleoside diphosphate kinase n=1 Tax=Ciceribacter thiooxidans TaxID=1969821 RepID=A0ABV7I4E4_9HYPH|nr:hypothetical protein [Ciceribacter thiooxidans]
MGQNPGMLAMRDRYVLEKLLQDRPPAEKEWLALLRRKLATRCLPEGAPIPAGLATIDSRVSFRAANGFAGTRTLCLAGTYAPGSAFLPVTTLYGLALLGLREGEVMGFDRPDGGHDWIMLERLHFRPAATREPAKKLRPSPALALRLAPTGLSERVFSPANQNGGGPDDGPGPGVA